MIQQFFQSVMRIFSPLVFVFAITLIAAPWIPVFAQRESGVTIRDRDIGEINRRLNEIDGLQIDRRLTVLETIGQEAKDNGWYSKGSSIGTGLLLVERVVRMGKRKKEEEEGE